jgi:hypothetical protein
MQENVCRLSKNLTLWIVRSLSPNLQTCFISVKRLYMIWSGAERYRAFALDIPFVLIPTKLRNG